MNKNQITRGTTSILLCLDLEEGSRELAEFCKHCAEDWDYPVQVIHIHSDGGREIEDAESDLSVIVDEILGNGNVCLAKIVTGTPEEHIIEFANKISGSPIIMIGRRKRRISDRIYVGSTTSAVISLSTYPVVVVPLNTNN